MSLAPFTPRSCETGQRRTVRFERHHHDLVPRNRITDLVAMANKAAVEVVVKPVVVAMVVVDSEGHLRTVTTET